MNERLRGLVGFAHLDRVGEISRQHRQAFLLQLVDDLLRQPHAVLELVADDALDGELLVMVLANLLGVAEQRVQGLAGEGIAID